MARLNPEVTVAAMVILVAVETRFLISPPVDDR